MKNSTLMIAALVSFGVGFFVGPMVLPSNQCGKCPSGIKTEGKIKLSDKKSAKVESQTALELEKLKKSAVSASTQIETLKSTNRDLALEVEKLKTQHMVAINDLKKKHIIQLRLALKDEPRKRADLNQDSKLFLYEKARFYAGEGKITEAVQSLQAALMIDPSDKDIYFDLAVIYDEQLDKPDRAVGCYAKYLELAGVDDPLRVKVETWKERCMVRARN